MMKFGSVIIYYNPTIETIIKLKIHNKIFDNILVVDNSDNPRFSIEDAVKKYNHVTYIDMHGNMGISVALNTAFVWAEEQKLDFLLTMDQDSNYSAENIEVMIDYIKENFEADVGIYVANFAKLYWDPKAKKMVAGKPAIPLKEVCEVKMCLTSGSFISIEAIRSLERLPDYFIGYVDNDISTKLRKEGYRLIRVGKSYFEQQVGEPVKFSWYNQRFRILHHQEIRYYYMVRNNCYYREKYKEDMQIVSSSYKLLFRLIFNIVFGEKRKIPKMKACYIGYKDYKAKIYGRIPTESLRW